MAECLVTIGSTGFNDLFEEINREEFFKAIFVTLGIRKLYVQKGNSKNELNSLKNLVGQFNTQSCVERSLNQKEIEVFDYDINIEDIIARCALVIGHCGAGTVTGVLGAGKHMVCVINETLMDNHQTELADKLFEMFEDSSCSKNNDEDEVSKSDNCNQSLTLKVCKVSELVEVLNNLDPKILSYSSSHKNNANLDENYVINIIDEMLLE